MLKLKTVSKEEQSESPSPAEIYERLAEEMWSDNPDPIKLAVLTGAIDMLRLHCNFKVPEIELAYIKLNNLTGTNTLEFLRKGGGDRCQQKFLPALVSSTH